MIPRVARSGKSFEGAAQYYLHDKLLKDANGAFAKVSEYMLHDKTPRRQTSERVGFTEILNMEAETAEAAFQQMSASYERYKEREAHKRGRKLTKPVYAYSLAWSPDQMPTKEDMMRAAHSSLKALRLDGLQTVVVQHTDEPQPHIHIIVNRIERDGQRARNIPYDHLRLSSWALAYEMEHGKVYCQRRLKHSELRRQGIFVKDKAPSLRRNGQQAVVDRTTHERQAVRAAQWRLRKQRAVLEQRQKKEKHACLRSLRQQIADVRHSVKLQFDLKFNLLRKAREFTFDEICRAEKQGPLERAVFVYRYYHHLSLAGKMRPQDIAWLCLSKKGLDNRNIRAWKKKHLRLEAEKQFLRMGAIAVVRREHVERLEELRRRHELERDGLAFQQHAEIENLRRNPPPYVPTPSKGIQPAPIVPALMPSGAPRLDVGHEIDLRQVDEFVKGAPILRSIFDDRATRGDGGNAVDIAKRVHEYRKRRPGMDFGLEL